MEQFKKKFLEEAADLIHRLESTLLRLEENPGDKSIIEEVFRVMHSLKGGSAMFGFQKTDAFTHELESIYDRIRNNTLTLDRNILDITLSSADHLKILIEKGEELSAAEESNHKVLLQRVHQIVNKETENSTDSNDAGHIDASAAFEQDDKNKTEILENVPTYYIRIIPGEKIFSNGTNPLLLIDELHSLGHCKAFLKKQNLPAFEDLNPESSYLAWELFLATAHSTDEIKDVFIFVEDICQVTIEQIADTNLLALTHFTNHLDEIISETDFTTKQTIENYVGTTLAKIKNDEPEVYRDKELVSLAKKTSINNIRVSSEKLDDLMSLVSELVTTQASLSLFAENFQDPRLTSIAEDIEKISRQLRDNTFEICLIPIETIMIRFKRLVRDLSSELDKEIQFTAEGTETELDKSIIEGLTEPLMHIFRNAIDHGIEPTGERLQKGKPKQGKIALRAFYSGASVYVQIKDDGRGIDVEKIRQKAIARGFIAAEANLSYKEILNLVFLPGFSTAAKVTELSGRGVGLDVVVKKISDIRGEVEIESQLGVGTTITIKLPLTLSIIDGLLVKIDTTHFVLPLSSVDKCFEVKNQDIDEAFNNKIVLDNQQIPFVHLRREFEMNGNAPQTQQMIRVHHDDFNVGLSVDMVVGEYQAVLKPLGRLFKDQEIVSGATILGDGTIALVLDPAKIINTFERETMLRRERYYKELGRSKATHT